MNIRIVQNKFRKSLFNLWSGCCISGCSIKTLLIASHIKPWSQSTYHERVDPYNGVLLTPNYDALFDKGFISFETDGKILISSELNQPDIDYFQIPGKTKHHFSNKHAGYLEYHQEMIFRK